MKGYCCPDTQECESFRLNDDGQLEIMVFMDDDFEWTPCKACPLCGKAAGSKGVLAKLKEAFELGAEIGLERNRQRLETLKAEAEPQETTRATPIDPRDVN